MKNSKLKTALEGLLESFKTGEVGEEIHRSFFLSRKDLPSSKWSISNRILMYVQGTSDARGPKQWNSVGRYVKRGTKAIWILGPMIKKVEVIQPTGDITLEETLVGFKGIPVFRFEDTDGQPLAELPKVTEERLPLLAVARKLGVSVQYEAAAANYYGYYSNQEKEIVLYTDSVSTWLHELAHAVHFATGYRTTEDHDGSKGAFAEVVAETVAGVLYKHLGLGDYSGEAYRYLMHYQDITRANPYKSVLKVLSEIEKTLNKIEELSQEEERENVCHTETAQGEV